MVDQTDLNEEINVLLVDDENDFRQILAKRLKRRGINVREADRGEKALRMLAEMPADIVVLDVKMPGMDGNATLVEIKRQFPMTEVIMLTGHATVESAIDGLKSGASDYLMKPTDVKDLIAKAEEAFSRRQGMEEKIRVARMRYLMKSPREIIANS